MYFMNVVARGLAILVGYCVVIYIKCYLYFTISIPLDKKAAEIQQQFDIQDG